METVWGFAGSMLKSLRSVVKNAPSLPIAWADVGITAVAFGKGASPAGASGSTRSAHETRRPAPAPGTASSTRSRHAPAAGRPAKLERGSRGSRVRPKTSRSASPGRPPRLMSRMFAPSGPLSDTMSCVTSGWSIDRATATEDTRPVSADTTASQTSASPVPSGIAAPPQEPIGVVAFRAAERSRRGVVRPVRLSSTGTPVARRRSNASAGSASGRACRVSRTAPVAAGAEAEVPEKMAVRPPPAAVVVQPTPGASIERPGPDELAHGTMSGPDRASSHEGGPFQATEPEEAEYTIPTAATFEKHAGQGRPDDLPSFPAAATAARPAARTAANVAAPAGSSVSQKAPCEESSARLRLTASMFQASRFDTAQSTAPRTSDARALPHPSLELKTFKTTRPASGATP